MTLLRWDDVPAVRGKCRAAPKSPPRCLVRVSGGHLCGAEAPTEAAAETVSCVSCDGEVVAS